jgi:hypothetical protein
LARLRRSADADAESERFTVALIRQPGEVILNFDHIGADMGSMLNRRYGSHRFICGLLAALMAVGPSASMAQQAGAPPEKLRGAADQKTVNNDKTLLSVGAKSDVDIAYVTPNASLVALLRPAQILKSPAAEMLPIEVMQAAMIKETSLDPLAAEHAVVSASPPGQGPPAYSVFLKFSQPANLQEGELTRHAEKASLGGKEYFQSKEMMAPSFYTVDERSLLAAPDFILQQLVGRPAAQDVAPLAAELAAADRGDDLLMLVDLEALRPLVMMAVAQAKLPPELASLQEIPALVKRAELRVNVSRPQPTELIVTARDEAGAERVVAIFNGMKQLLAKKMKEESQKALASDDPVEQAGGRYSQRMMTYWDARMQLVREGDRLILFRGDLANNPSQQLTYIATIGVLVALLLPAVQAAREAARRNASMNNIKQIMIALLNYETAKRRFPAQANLGPDGKLLLSWRVHILPYIDEHILYKQFHLNEPWDSPHNKGLIAKMPGIYLDPSSKFSPADGKTHYLGVEGEGRFFDSKLKDGRALASIRDGTSNTIAIVQVDDSRALEWTRPDDWEMDENDPLAGLGNLHSGDIFLAGYCDGHVTAVSRLIDPSLFKSLLTVAGGEKLDDQ